MTSDPFRRFYSTAAGMLSHLRAGDPDAVKALAETATEGVPDDQALDLQRALLFATVELANDILNERPADPEQWLTDRIHHYRDPQG